MPEVLIHLAEGRTDAQKKAVMLDVTQALVTHLGVAAEAVVVQIVEAKLTDKMKGGRTYLERRG